MGEYMKNELAKKCEQDFVDHVRGIGMMIGVQLTKDGNPLVDKGREKGLLMNCTSDTVLRFVPPFVITREQIDKAVSIVSELSF